VIEVTVDLGDRSYPVIVGHGARHRLLEVLPAGVKKVAIVTQAAVGVSVDPGVASRTFVIDDGEQAKSLETIEELCRGFAQMELSKNDCVVCVGGGVVTDAGGFAAAVYHRGVSVIHVATTLLAQVDAAIGGKTGVNIPEGKNLIGAIWQPSAVLCDTEVVQNLPPREYVSGTGEMAKYHFLGSRVGMDDSHLRDAPLDERVAFCAELKAKVVAQDERDGGLRNILNYGHTLAHALEIAGTFDLRHGEAVAIGVHFAARLSRELGRIEQSRVDEHVRLLEFYGLPTALPARVDVHELIRLMRRDKKSHGSLTFVLDGSNGVEMVRDVDEAVVRRVLEAMPR
jgi:5-deoxy-5-amino-3-dehydroquinate synthase